MAFVQRSVQALNLVISVSIVPSNSICQLDFSKTLDDFKKGYFRSLEMCFDMCKENSDCFENQYCFRGVCVDQCFEDIECEEGYQCTFHHECQKSCSVDKACLQNEYCDIYDGVCTRKCQTDQGCHMDYKCISGICQKSCKQESDCFHGFHCERLSSKHIPCLRKNKPCLFKTHEVEVFGRAYFRAMLIFET